MLCNPRLNTSAADPTRPVAEWLALTALVTTLNGCEACKIRQPCNCLQDSETLRERRTQRLQGWLYRDSTFCRQDFSRTT